MSTSPPLKRRPTVLVTDTRDSATRSRSPPQRRPSAPSIPSMVRFISVDSVLQESSQIPSGQSRNPLARARGAPASPSRSTTPKPSDPRRFLGQNLPVRSSKLSEKLVLLPETDEEANRWGYGEDDIEDAPIKDDEEEWRNRLEGDEESPEQPPRKSYAERLPKSRRADKLSRVTAYCTADAYRLNDTSKFLREKHSARTKLYDECLYCAYHLPIMSGDDGYRVRSSPALKSPGGKAVLDVQIERSEQRNYHEGYFEDSYTGERRTSGDGSYEDDGDSKSSGKNRGFSQDRTDDHHTYNQGYRPESPRDSHMNDMKAFAEMFVFRYGVVVFWGFSERQEKDILADLTFAQNDLGIQLISGRLKEDEFETEEFHFQYSSRTRSPRIYNDMITLRSGDIMIKLAISHAIAQSTKLCRFEERMNSTMLGVQQIPKKLALTGKLGMKREEVVKMSGKLFKLRVDVNLSSNVLDVPEFFWDAEPTLHPLYAAVREYLEIKQRILVLNERCRVFLDLTEILSDSIADSNMSRITWIIIILIVLSIFVTTAEVAIRFGLLSARKKVGEL